MFINDLLTEFRAFSFAIQSTFWVQFAINITTWLPLPIKITYSINLAICKFAIAIVFTTVKCRLPTCEKSTTHLQNSNTLIKRDRGGL